MIGTRRFAVALLLLLGFAAEARSEILTAQGAENRPNFLIILVDDLGYSDLGFMGSEIRTPTLDALAERSLLLTDFTVSPACSPTRAMLLTGTAAHTAGFGTMYDEASPEQLGKVGYEGVLSDRVVTVAEVLRDAGYFTALSGKWHLGRGPGRRPTDRGFERAFGPVHGGATHFNDRLALFSSGGPPGPAGFENDGKPIGNLPDDWFSSTGFTNALIEQLERGAMPSTHEPRPFFAVASYTAPHWPLQAPDDWIDRYAGRYDSGWDTLRKARIAALEARGIIPEGSVTERLPFVPPWDDLAPEERERAARVMEVYAAMVEHLDHEIGRLLSWLEGAGLNENTYVFFFSDNGAEGNPVNRIVSDHGWVERTFDNRIENIGRRVSYVFPGPGWAQASTAPFRLFKTFPSEGGIRTPALFSGPGVVPAGLPSSRTRARATILDMTPTVLDLAGVQHPSERTAAWPAPIGRSLVPLLQDSGEIRAEPPYVIELFGRRAVRSGPWKALWLYEPYGTGRWALFNLDKDPGERMDLANAHPEQLRNLLSAYERYASEHQVRIPRTDAGYALEDDWRAER